jgi:hypothetical protein
MIVIMYRFQPVDNIVMPATIGTRLFSRQFGSTIFLQHIDNFLP